MVNSFKISKNRGKVNFTKIFFILYISFFLIGGFPVSAQEKFQPLFQSNTVASVTLDGRAIFKVSGAENLTAQERAEVISSKLQQAVTSTQPLEVEVKFINQQPTIWLNNSYLLTVTQEDTQNQKVPEDQAQIWRSELEESVNEARKERSIDFLKKATFKAVLALSLGILLHWGLAQFWYYSLRRFLQ